MTKELPTDEHLGTRLSGNVIIWTVKKLPTNERVVEL
jgi:hypothetical protein